ncbi:MAG: TIGR02444 family protein [Beijerinckiaceae bacterium]|nr:TIGR02444 family protein [Beijerinckiaceae bacterium]
MERGSEFWRFSLSFYRINGVPPSCIALQDLHGLDVNIMLFALWLASKGRAISALDIQQADELVRDWRVESVVALRSVRRYLRDPPPAFAGDAVVALRDRIKAAELESERLQQEALFALRPPEAWGRAEEPLRAAELNLDACAQNIGSVFDDGSRQALLGAFHALVAARAP